jgi:hypothetical protein
MKARHILSIYIASPTYCPKSELVKERRRSRVVVHKVVGGDAEFGRNSQREKEKRAHCHNVLPEGSLDVVETLSRTNRNCLLQVP